MSNEEEPEQVKLIRAMAAVMRTALEREFPTAPCDHAVVACLAAAADYVRTCAHLVGDPIDHLETNIRLGAVINSIIDAERRRKSGLPS